MAEIAVDIRRLEKNYGGVTAVRDVTLAIEKGEIFGLIGPDGAGKTTMFQILAGVMNATSGQAMVFGKSSRDARVKTGYLTQGFTLYPDLTVMENIRYTGDLRLVPVGEAVTRGRRYLQLFGMDRFADRLAGQLSGGMQKKLALACALVPQPEVLLLDEPTTGVDPVSRREFWDSLTGLAAEGLTILVATPYIDEAERCTRVAFMHSGQIKRVDTPEAMRAGMAAKRLEVRLSSLREAHSILPALASTPRVIDVQRFGDHIDVLVEAAYVGDAQRSVERVFNDARVRPEEVRIDEPTLENVFVAAIRAAEPEAGPVDFPFTMRPAGRAGVAIGAADITKSFGSFTAVNGVNLEVRYGEIYGLLGANGAGKTTTIRMLCGLLEPTSGIAQLAGTREHLRLGDVRRRVGYMSQKFSLYNDLSVGENLDFFAGVYGVPKAERRQKIEWVLQFSGLKGKEHEITGSLPGGWKQRVAFGAAIMHEPSVLFLDEPTSGVDPIARRAFWRMIDRLADSGTAILVTTHYLEEAEQCNRLGFMSAGRIIAEGTPSEVKANQRGHLLEFRVNRAQRAAEVLRTRRKRWRVSVFGDRVHVVVDAEPAMELAGVRRELEAGGISVFDARQARFSLEDVFIGAVEGAREAA